MAFPETIERVISSDWIGLPNYTWEVHPEYGLPFAIARGNIAYVVNERTYRQRATIIEKKHNERFHAIREMEIQVVNQYCRLFYRQGYFDWWGYARFWERVVKWYRTALEFHPPSPEKPRNDTDWPLWSGQDIFHDAALTTLPIGGTNQIEFFKWFDFWMYCLSTPVLKGPPYERFMARYLRAKRDKYELRLATHRFTHFEGDFYVALWEKSSRETYPLATCGFRCLPDIGIIENLQGSRFGGKPELGQLPWKWLLVRAAETLCRDLGLKAMLFRPGKEHWYYQKYHAGIDLVRRMDETALELKYNPCTSLNGKPFYAKSLDNKLCKTSDFTNWPHINELLALKLDESDTI